MQINELRSERLSQPLGIYSQGMEVINPQRLIFVSGFTSRNAQGEVVGRGDIKEQTETILGNMKIFLEEAGSGMDDIVKLTVFITDMELFKEIHEVRARYFNKPYPACSMVEVSRLVDKDQLIEIEAIAALKA